MSEDRVSAPGRSGLAIAAVLAATAVLAWIPRTVEGIRYPYPRTDGSGGASWFSRSPDGLYHTRRVERALREGAVAGTDPYLDFPDGAMIPWPPYYDLFLAAALGPFAPEDAGLRRSFLEQGVATLPMLLGIASALLAALAVWNVAAGRPTAARAAGALFAAGTFAACRSSINYSVLGEGDHHAWVSFLGALLLGLLSAGIGAGALRSRPRALAWGAAAGAIAGLLVGSWVASLLYVIHVQLVLGWLVLRRAREPLPGVACLGAAFHAAAAAMVLPAVLRSPWKRELPWTVVNLSWFHWTELLIGALVFVPLLLAGSGALAAGTRWARRYPWIVLGLLATLATVLGLAGTGPGRGIAEGFAWISRSDPFMDTVLESLPLVGPRSGGPHQLFQALGLGILLLPFALAALAWAAFRRRQDELLPWAIALPPLLVQALLQRRFADPLAVPMAVALGWALARAARGPGWALAPLALALSLLLQAPALTWVWRQHEIAAARQVGARDDAILGERRLYEWLRESTPAPADYSVLAHWDRGHALEWVADRPTVATNFGSYVGQGSYLDPSRFYLAEDPQIARAILEARRARYVLVPGSLPQNLESMIRAVDPALRGRYLIDHPEGPRTSQAWLATMGARLIAGGRQVMPPEVPPSSRSNPLGFLRLVHVSPWRETRFRDPATGEPLPVGFVWEHVPGALIAARGRAGDEVRLELRVRYPEADHVLEWLAVERCDGAGIARLWVPYSTEAPNGDGIVEDARWSIGERSGALAIPDSAVMGGKPLWIE